VYFLPAGSPRGLFGDGDEYARPYVWALLAKKYSERVPSNFGKWNVEQWQRHLGNKFINLYSDSLDYLYGPMQEELVAKPEVKNRAFTLPNGAFFPSIGWAAMHSDLHDPQRNSIYFRSSDFGSHGHAHASQNSFVIHALGRALVMASGYYDYFNSQHHNDWTQLTVAHNAITFDGGQGQDTRNINAAGLLTNFYQSQKFDTVVGGATAAYGGKLEKAVRTLLYIRPKILLIYDSLASKVPRVWEWNFHSLEKMMEYEPNKIRVTNGPVVGCFEPLSVPKIDFTRTNDFPVEPVEIKGPKPKQWHGTYRSRIPSSEVEFLFLFKFDCAAVETSDIMPLPNGDLAFNIEGYSVEIGSSGGRVIDKKNILEGQ